MSCPEPLLGYKKENERSSWPPKSKDNRVSNGRRTLSPVRRDSDRAEEFRSEKASPT